ncbi:MAG: fused MFS/spermidine synthase [Actinomycetota bacterium]
MSDAGESTDPSVRALPSWLAIVLVFGTSAVVLVLEILAGRLMAPYVGVSLETFTGIIGTILAGIAVGAWAGGVAADRVDPRRLLGPLLVAGGVLAIATIPIVRVLGESGGSAGGVRIIVLTAFGFLPSATVLSAVPPAVVKLQLRDLDSTGATVGQLSAWGTVGALFGTFFTGYVLVAAAAVTTLIVTVGVVLVIGGLVLFVLDRRTARTARSVPGPKRAVSPEDWTVMGLGGVLALSLLGVAGVDSPCQRQTAYYCLSIVEDPSVESGRTLVLDDLRHSYVDLDDPLRLEFWYVRRIIDTIEVHHPGSSPIDVLSLGGGAFTVPRYVRETRPGSEQVVLEIDQELVDVVLDDFEFEPGPDVSIVVGDARLSVRDLPDDSADVAVGDAFGSRSVPFHLATEEFLADVDRVLRDDGVYVGNLIDGTDETFLRAQAATLGRVFAHVVVVRGPLLVAGNNGNSVILASDAPLDVESFAELLRADRDPSETDLERRERVGPDGAGAGEIVAGDELVEYLDGATVLTDDFAPVDQLIGG